MRVTVVCPDDHPVSPGAEFAFRLGRVEDGIHNHLLHTGETIPMDEFLGALVEQARQEYPDHEVRVDVLVQNDKDPTTSHWVTSDEYDPEVHARVGAGAIREREFTIQQMADTGSE